MEDAVAARPSSSRSRAWRKTAVVAGGAVLRLTDHPQPRPVQHHDLRAWTTAIAASSAGATSSSSILRPCGAQHPARRCRRYRNRAARADSAAPQRLHRHRANIARGSIAAYYPEANGLVPLTYHDPQSGTPSYKSVPSASCATPDAARRQLPRHRRMRIA